MVLKEWVGQCIVCGKDIYCLDGFLNGVKEQGELFCFDCEGQDE
ncbi:hypothetical protein [Domibacillus indicus]|nr:hypothetical protein [Domibacillus indicus]